MPFEKSYSKNGLGGTNRIFALIKNQYCHVDINNLFKFFKRGYNISLPVIDKNGSQKWENVQDIKFVGRRRTLKQILSSGIYSSTIATQNFPYIVYVSEKKSDLPLRIRFKEIQNLRKQDRIWVKTKFYIKFSKDKKEDYSNGFFVRFFLAEGNYIYYKHEIKDGSQYSEYALRRWANEKGYSSVKDYLKARKKKKVKGLQLSCGKKDITNKYLEKIPFNLNVNQYGNSVHVTIYNEIATKLIQKYIAGTTSKTKNLKTSVFNSSKAFLEGLLDGFIAGDGHQERTRISIGITNNRKLRDDLLILCKIFGLEPRYREYCVKASKESKKIYKVLSLRITYFRNRIIRNNIVYYSNRIIESGSIERIYEVLMDSNEFPEKLWNSLLILGNGIIVQC